MPWSTSDRRSRLPTDWPSTRRRILTRDDYRCTRIEDNHRCVAEATDVDHITPGDNHHDTNLTSLCRRHHQTKTTSEGHAAMRVIRQTGHHPAETHPGLT